ncbi:MAG: methyltransferase [Candidatus Limnocylindrales bacterium]
MPASARRLTSADIAAAAIRRSCGDIARSAATYRSWAAGSVSRGRVTPELYPSGQVGSSRSRITFRFDQAHVAGSDATRALLERQGVSDRCETVSGSFESVPAGPGGYLMKSILHDWEDDEAIRILRTIQTAALPTSQLFVAELVIGAPNEDLAGRILDLHMLVMPGGRERTEKAWRWLFERGGWQLTDVRTTATSFRLLIGTPA